MVVVVLLPLPVVLCYSKDRLEECESRESCEEPEDGDLHAPHIELEVQDGTREPMCVLSHCHREKLERQEKAAKGQKHICKEAQIEAHVEMKEYIQLTESRVLNALVCSADA